MAAPRRTRKAAPPSSRRQPLGRKKASGNGIEKKLADALAQQAATAEILRAIARSRTDEGPVFKAIVESAHRLCGASFSILYRYDGKMLRIATDSQSNSKASAVLRALYPMAPRRDHIVGLAVLGRKETHTVDIWRDARFPASQSAHAKASGYRAGLVVPLLRNGAVIGAIAIGRLEAQAFSRGEIGLMRSFADQAVIAIENVRLFNETKEALERQTATAEILKVIASSPAEVQPVFDAIVLTAKRLIGAFSATVTHVGDGMLHLVAHTATTPEGAAALNRFFPISVEGTPMGRAILSRRPAFIDDFESDPNLKDADRDLARTRGFRGVVFVPLLRGDVAIGSLNVTRRETGRMSDHHVDLLKTFADQAVIAIENVRLFNETKEALERQTATAEILKVIASSPADVEPVFNAILRSAVSLCGAEIAAVFPYDGKLVHLGATHNWSEEAKQYFSKIYPAPPDLSLMSGRTILAKSVVKLADAAADVQYDPNSSATGHWRRMLGVPILREDAVLGALVVCWREPGDTPQRQVDLLQTFADQAAIAIENVRLFNETKEALERQTATAEILKVIASSPADTRPVFEAIAQSGLKLFRDAAISVALPGGDMLRLAAIAGADAQREQGWRSRFPFPLAREYIQSAAMLDCRVVDIADVRNGPPEFDIGIRNFIESGFMAITAMPMVRGGSAIGVISVVRKDAGPLSASQIDLLQTFADQAVIAIENVRLFNELQQRTEALTKSVGQLTALGEVGQAISSSLDIETVLQTIVSRAVQLTGMDAGSIYEYDERGEVYLLQAAEKMAPELVEEVRRTPIRKGDGATGQTAVTLQPVQVPDIQEASYHGSRKENLVRTGYRAVLAVPLLREGQLLGALQVFRSTPGAFAPEIVELLKTFATQSALAIQNARLFREIAEKGKQLEVASRHKSDFLANMSHELRTPLNAIIGFSEVLIERMFGELNEKQADYMKDIHESGRHLLSLINDILDLSKIEAGRMDLEVSSFDLPAALANAMTLVRERAQRHGIALGLSVDPALGGFAADERKFKQILLNLLSNAVKFTPDGGRVDVTAALGGALVTIAVRDTGVGIAPADHAAAFEEFRQVGSDYTRKAEGTGLGLALTKRFVELHGGEIRLESQPGKGSTFTFTLPVRA